MKHYDENGHIVGISYGTLTDNVKEEYSKFNLAQVLDLLSNAPEKKGHRCHLFEEYIEDAIPDPYVYSYKFEKIPENELSDEDLKKIFQEEILNSIVVNELPAAKEGYEIKPVLSGNTIAWEFVKSSEISGDGSYLNPITYAEGMEVEAGMWYTYGDNIWEAIQNGIPVDFNDNNYFDIIG